MSWVLSLGGVIHQALAVTLPKWLFLISVDVLLVALLPSWQSHRAFYPLLKTDVLIDVARMAFYCASATLAGIETTHMISKG